MTLHDVALDDKFDLGKERIFLSGAQAVIRMLLMQRERDRRNGLNTAGFVSGYRGSPLGGFDLQLWKARKQLAEASIVFQPGLNEELAATACWGSQQAELLGEGKHDGVFSVWYGKGPGVDRSGDVFRHANLAGSSKHGGVLALMGDDHLAESSTIAHATEFLFVDTMIPILNPAGVQELIDYGLYGYGLSRFAGTWTAIKCVKDNIEFDGLGRRLAGPAEDRHPRNSTCRPAGSISATRSTCSARRSGCTSTSGRRRRRSSAPTTSTASSIRAGKTPRSASSPSARAISTCARRSTTSASTRPAPPGSACGCPRSAAPGRSTSSISRRSRAGSR